MESNVYRNELFADEVAEMCYKKYDLLPKKGKPQTEKEWTLLAAVVMATKQGNEENMQVICIGTGSKCIGQSKLSSTGDILNDSHAEVLARRAFMSYLYDQLCLVYRGEESEALLLETDGRCSLKQGVSFHFFSSHTFCGDSSIFSKISDEDYGDAVINNLQAKANVTGFDIPGQLDSDKKSVDVNTTNIDRHRIVKRKSQDLIQSDIKKMKVENEYKDNDSLSPDCKTKLSNKGDNFVKIDQDACNSKFTSEMNCTSLMGNNSVSINIDLNKCQLTNSVSILHNLCYKSREMGANSVEFENSVYSKGIAVESLACSQASWSVLNQKQKVCNTDFTTENRKNDGTDIYRTGAKCVVGGSLDELGPLESYHKVGLFRTKPGRGDRTLSMSCSDKMARWNVVGCQGALLSHFLSTPIYFDSLIIGKCPYSEAALHRSVIERSVGVVHLPDSYHVNQPQLLHSSLLFPHSRLTETLEVDETKTTPSPASIIWHKRQGGDVHDVVVNGKRQGFTKKKLSHPNARSCVCSAALFKRFVQTIDTTPTDKLPQTLRSVKHSQNLCYLDYKTMATDYQTAWKQLLSTFKIWSHKPKEHLEYLPDK